MTDTAVVPAGEVIDEGEGSDYVDQGDADLAAQAELLGQLNPCRLCGSMQSQSPTGPDHNFPHCFKCGYRPGVAPTPGAVLSTVGPGLSPAQVDAALAELRRGVVADILAAIKQGADPSEVTVTHEPGAGEA